MPATSKKPAINKKPAVGKGVLKDAITKKPAAAEASLKVAGKYGMTTVVLPPPTRRLRSKITLLPKSITTLVGLVAADETKDSGPRQVYLVTLPHPKQQKSQDGYTLIAPGSLTREQVLHKFLDSCRSPVYVDARNIRACPSVPLDKTGVWREMHQADANGQAYPHDHLPVLASRQFRFMPVKRALLRRHGLASNWSVSHTGYWSCMKYLAKPSPKKQSSSLDHQPVLWCAHGMHPVPATLCNEPLTAAAIEARRQTADDKAAETGAKPGRISEIDVWPIVVNNNIRNGGDDDNAHKLLISHAKKHCTKEMQQFLFKIRTRLPALIEDIWAWEKVESDLAVAMRTRTEAIQAAAQTKCVCEGQWKHHVLKSWKLNGIDGAELCKDILNALVSGRSESTPVIVLAGDRGGEGKSMLLKALLALFGSSHVFSRPAPGNFPLVDLPGKKCCFLDEWRFDQSILSFALQCVWYDGSIVPIARPQNQPGKDGHYSYEGNAPIFVTTKRKDLLALQSWAADDPSTGVPWDADASMLWRRLKVYHFTTRIPKPAKDLKYCPCCFAQLLVSNSSDPSTWCSFF